MSFYLRIHVCFSIPKNKQHLPFLSVRYHVFPPKLQMKLKERCIQLFYKETCIFFSCVYNQYDLWQQLVLNQFRFLKICLILMVRFLPAAGQRLSSTPPHLREPLPPGRGLGSGLTQSIFLLNFTKASYLKLNH